MKETYHPAPIDTTQMDLTAEIKVIVERLAENAMIIGRKNVSRTVGHMIHGETIF